MEKNKIVKLNTDTELEDIKSISETVVIPIVNSPIFPGMIAPIILGQDKFTKELEDYIDKSGHVGLNLVKFKEEFYEAEDHEDDHEFDEEEELTEEELIQHEKKLERAKNRKELEGEEASGYDYSDDEINLDGLTSHDIYRVGVYCKVVKKIRLPDGSVNILVHGLKRYRISKFVAESPLLIVEPNLFEDVVEVDEELDAYTRSVINQVKKLSEINPYFNEEMKLAMLNTPSPGALADLVSFSLSLDVPEAQDYLETLNVKKRFGKLLVYLKREKDVADIQKKITDEVNDKVNKYQREYFLREQLKVIRSELGIDEDDKTKDLNKIREGIEKANMTEDAKKAALEELDRLESIPDSSPEFNVTRTYLNWMIALPWDKSTNDDIDIAKSRKTLDKDHYGLEQPKERILEFLAVRKLRPEYDGTILCLAGPPGVGKTSLGHSIATSLGRKFYRFSLGGMRDEAEIKGHRRTYVGAMPGKLIQALKRVEVNNPVIMLDEIDKLGQSFQGDPASALLEVLDPEQNKTFIDNYLDVPFDLSKVLFIATANYIGEIPEPLLDRMELIELSGYTREEKISIANKWILPKQLKKHGLTNQDVSITSQVLKSIIADYAREPGVRSLEQFLAKICRKAALAKVTSKRKKKFVPTIKSLEDILGPKRFHTEKMLKPLSPGIVTGLAWTSYGGELLQVETIPLKGKGFKLTGQVGDVMNESATLAYSYIKRLLQEEIDTVEKSKPKSKKSKAKQEPAEDECKNEDGCDYLANHEVHLHLPAGATPKDGPSAGITMALALYSLAHNKRVKSDVAMTGELSLTGNVLPVGGIKEKVLAAKRAGLKRVILPIENEKDLKEVPERHRKGLKFFPVKQFKEILPLTLVGVKK